MTEAALQAVRDYVCGQITYAMCNVDGTWTRTDITSAQTLEGGYIAIGFMVPPGNEAEVTGIRLHDAQGVVWLEQEVSIHRSANDESLYFSARIKVYAE